jgi:undecaprenyl-diphosphatase
VITYFQAIIMGLIQGVTELFPISSLGHSVLVPYLFGWHNIVTSETGSESFFLAFLVALHVATALALLIYYRQEWVRLIAAFFSSVRKRRITTSYERLIWLLIIATIPAGLMGLIFEHILRTQFAKPLSAIVFLFINGLILLTGDRYARRQARTRKDFTMETTADHTAKALTTKRAGLIGTAQVFALLAGISRSGITMVSGLYSGLDYEDSARFSFLLATPIILAAGVYKLHDLTGPNGNGVRGQILAGAIVTGIAAYLSVRFLDKYFRNKSLRPFGIYSIAGSVLMLLLGLARGHF